MVRRLYERSAVSPNQELKADRCIQSRISVWVRVLGSAAGGGFPQWNCDCPRCRAAHDGSRPCRPRTQSSVAVSADYRRWFLLNASPDIRAQIEAFYRETGRENDAQKWAVSPGLQTGQPVVGGG